MNTSRDSLLDLCFAALDEASIMPYYFYMCDMIPAAEHWRLSVAEGQALQDSIMGYLPGFATPRVVCDVPYAGKKWIHQTVDYDRVRGISHWRSSWGDSNRSGNGAAASYEYFDPVYTLPPEGVAWWREQDGTAASNGDGAQVSEAASTTG